MSTTFPRNEPISTSGVTPPAQAPPQIVEHHYAEKSVVQVDRGDELPHDELVRFHAIRLAIDAGGRFLLMNEEAEGAARLPDQDRIIQAAQRIETYILGGAA